MTSKRPHPLFDGIRTGPDGLHAYFVHSYHLAAKQRRTMSWRAPIMAARSPLPSARDNMFGTQFHPEKSQTLGLA